MSRGLGGAAATCLTVAAALIVAPAAATGGTLDQQQTATGTFQEIQAQPTPFSVAQTFTPGISGKLDQVDLFSGQVGSPDAVLRVEIRGTAGGVINENPLASSSSGGVGSPDWLPITFEAPAAVQAGTLYAIVAYTFSTPSGSGYSWLYDHPADYAGGQQFTSTGAVPPTGFGFVPTTLSADTAFRTYVQPTPAGGGPGGAATTTGQRAAALKKCKKKHSRKAKKKCKKKANRLPV